MADDSIEATVLLELLRDGDEHARNRLVGLLYDQFRRRAQSRLRGERIGHSLGATDLANEALLRLLMGEELAKAKNRNELHRAFARAMRQTLIDHARRRNANKRGRGRVQEELDELAADVRRRSGGDMESVHEALVCLADQAEDENNERARRAASALEMKFFGRFTHPEIAAALDVSLTTIERDLPFGLAWMRKYLSRE